MFLRVLSTCVVFIIIASCSAQEADLDEGGDIAEGNARIVRVRRQIGPSLMKLKLNCPDSDAGLAVLTLFHDGDAVGYAACKNGNFSFRKLDVVTSQLTLRLNGSEGADIHGPYCQMHTSSGLGKTYAVVASFAHGTNVTALFFAVNEENALCNYDDLGNSFGNLSKILRPLQRPKDTPIYKGGPLLYNITMEVVNFLDEPITGGSIAMNRFIRLKATVDTLLKNIYPISCSAINSAKAKYEIIRGSCGDGVVFGLNDGFIAHGNVTYSPYFRVFRLPGPLDLQFKCLFATCDLIDCNNKNSCPYGQTHYPTLPPIILPG